MSEKVYYTCTAMPVNKKGVLRKDENGYYTFPIGGLDVFNASGDFYTLKGAREIFEDNSSHFQRRIRDGVLHGECGHPEPQPGQSYQDFARRVHQIVEKNIAVHYRRIWLDFDSIRDESGRQVVAIMAELAPAGPFGPALENSLNNPNINTCFSIRSFTEDRTIGGTLHRRLTNVITFDHVMESGIRFARKYNNPALESLVSVPIMRKDLLSIVRNKERDVAMESAALSCQDLFRFMGWSMADNVLPISAMWGRK